MRIEYRTEPEYIEYLDGETHPKVSPRPAWSRSRRARSHFASRVDFRKRTIVAHTPDGKTEQFQEPDRFTNEPFPWFTFELRKLFSVLDPIPDCME